MQDHRHVVLLACDLEAAMVEHVLMVHASHAGHGPALHASHAVHGSMHGTSTQLHGAWCIQHHYVCMACPQMRFFMLPTQAILSTFSPTARKYHTHIDRILQILVVAIVLVTLHTLRHNPVSAAACVAQVAFAALAVH